MTLKLVFMTFSIKLMDSVKNKPASSLVASLRRRLAGFAHLGVIDRWPVTPKRARYSALIAFS